MKHEVLIADDDAGMLETISLALEMEGCRGHTAESYPQAIRFLKEHPVDVVVTDLVMGEESGLDVCRAALELDPSLPVVVMTGFGSMDTAIGAMRAGAYDFITKPFEIEHLVMTVRRALNHISLNREVQRLKREIALRDPLPTIMGESPQVKKLHQTVRQVAPSMATVLISGESGTGKELVARSIHDTSDRSEGPFVALNCAAVPATLLESELFGHAKGSFTDAKSDKPGLLLQASGGTLFLDEIGEMPLEMQAKLLRVLQERKLRPVGGTREVEFDARILAATNRDLESAVEDGTFREDLYYRINVVSIHVPPLRSRGRDVLLLAQEFVRQFADRDGKDIQGLSPAAAEKLLSYDWPGNVRELQNCIERAIALSAYQEVQADDLPPKIRLHRSDRFALPVDSPDDFLPLHEVERRYINRVLKAVDGNKSVAAKLLGFNRRTLYRKLERFDSGKGDFV